jgi:hypothetical protein
MRFARGFSIIYSPHLHAIGLTKSIHLGVYRLLQRFWACFQNIFAPAFNVFWGTCVSQANSPSIGVGTFV